MRDTLRQRCELFLRNREIIRSEFRWESAYLYPLCASIFTAKGREADGASMQECRRLLRERTGFFSKFRTVAQTAIVSLLALESDPEQKLNNALAAYEALKEKFYSSYYLPMAAMVVSDLGKPEQFPEIAARARNIYELMKAEHPFLTSGEDSTFAVLLAFSEREDRQIIEETERCYELLKPEVFSGNAVQSLSHVLALGRGSAELKCRRCLELLEALRESRHAFGTGYELPALGSLALVDVGIQVLVREIGEVDEFLKSQKGFGSFGIGSKQRVMYAGMLVSGDYLDDSNDLSLNAAAINGTIALIAAQQAAICAAVAASSAAAAAASSSSS